VANAVEKVGPLELQIAELEEQRKQLPEPPIPGSPEMAAKQSLLRKLARLKLGSKRLDSADQVSFLDGVHRKAMVSATEILTTGMKRLHSDPLLFLRTDPEFFSFVVKTLRDW